MGETRHDRMIPQRRRRKVLIKHILKMIPVKSFVKTNVSVPQEECHGGLDWKGGRFFMSLGC